MDCDTTGIEPDLGLVKFKSRGGGNMAIVNQTVPRALRKLATPRWSHSPSRPTSTRTSQSSGRPVSSPSTCRSSPAPWATTPFTTWPRSNDGCGAALHLGSDLQDGDMPEDATIEDVENLHMDAWKLGVKAVAIYRDNCRSVSHSPPRRRRREFHVVGDRHDSVAPNCSRGSTISKRRSSGEVRRGAGHRRTVRERMPRRRVSTTFSFRVADCEGYVPLANGKTDVRARCSSRFPSRFDPRGHHGCVLDLAQPGSAARCAARDVRAQVRQHEVRAIGYDRRR